MTVFQRTPNYVLPGRNYNIDEHQAHDIRYNYDRTWQRASQHGFGLDMEQTGRSFDNKPDAERIKQVLDSGWESGGFHFQFETFDDIFTNQESNDVVSEYVRNKIRAIVKDQETAEVLCPKYPILSKRPPCGHCYYEAYNRANVKLVDISNDSIDLNETGIRTESGTGYDFDMIIFAIGFDAATGALAEIDIRGCQGNSLKELWSMRLQTFAGILVPGFPNMFMVVGPHVPFGNMPMVIDRNVEWIGKALRHLEQNKLAHIDVSEAAVDAWSQHVNDAFAATILAESARAAHAWFVGANVPGKTNNILFYFGGIPNWYAWLEKESEGGWPSMKFAPLTSTTSNTQISVESQSGVEVATSA